MQYYLTTMAPAQLSHSPATLYFSTTIHSIHSAAVSPSSTLGLGVLNLSQCPELSICLTAF